MQAPQSISGHSLVMNFLLVLLNVGAVALIAMGFHDAFESFKWLFAGIGFATLIGTSFLLFVFKGTLMIASFSRILVGGLFIVSGLIKANDPIGFSYKLEEYFEDGALAYRFKEWFGLPEFSLEFLIQYALAISIFICVLEIVLGVLVLIGGKMRWVSSLLLLLMIFFTFLTAHTASCDASKWFNDRDTYPIESFEAQAKLELAKSSKSVKIVSQTLDNVTIDELKHPQCVSDCGCFGDAMKGSVGRSLTPKESLWKDIVLMYFIVWIFIANKKINSNTVGQNWFYIPVSLIIVLCLCWVFDWYFPILFSFVTLLGALYFNQWRLKYFGGYFAATFWVILCSSAFSSYALFFDPIRDYRPYAVGNYLPKLTKNGKNGVFETILVYKHKKTGEIKSFKASEPAYFASKIWDKKDVWKLVKTENKELVPTRFASIDTIQFNPSRTIASLSEEEMKLPFIQKQLKHRYVPGLKLEENGTKKTIEIPLVNYHVESYPLENYQIIDTIEVENQELTEVSIRDYIFSAPKLLVLFSNHLTSMDVTKMNNFKKLVAEASKAGVPCVMVVNATDKACEVFKQKYHFSVPIFRNDGIELKAVARLNPCLVVLKKGWVVGKYTTHALPEFNWINTKLLNK